MEDNNLMIKQNIVKALLFIEHHCQSDICLKDHRKCLNIPCLTCWSKSLEIDIRSILED